MSGALVGRESQRSLDFMDESKNCLPGWIGKTVYSRTPRTTIRAPIVGYRELARSIPASKKPYAAAAAAGYGRGRIELRAVSAESELPAGSRGTIRTH